MAYIEEFWRAMDGSVGAGECIYIYIYARGGGLLLVAIASNILQRLTLWLTYKLLLAPSLHSSAAIIALHDGHVIAEWPRPWPRCQVGQWTGGPMPPYLPFKSLDFGLWRCVRRHSVFGAYIYTLGRSRSECFQVHPAGYIMLTSFGFTSWMWSTLSLHSSLLDGWWIS